MGAALIRLAVSAGVVTLVIAAGAIVTHLPMLFPSLGPTAYLLFATPLAEPASPRNTVLGHLIGVLAGAVGLAVFGLLHTPPDLTAITWPRAGAAALALALTCGGMAALRLPHPPAGATTLIVALGLLRSPADLAMIMVSVLALTVLGGLLNRARGIRYPLWRIRPAAPATTVGTHTADPTTDPCPPRQADVSVPDNR
ncbi:HPP family protein [Crossiella sp. CA-258035]|uniref:HPP family protein n=1 Tax=Crossiella sp. CA-258035 TaxID=2981138 RepID=UPI0024BCD1DA|nr:HPP family protein [Crossiella sp. CA-258035]WHT16500.1 HPP family protein [Crossiella sp. CA-258035]